MLEIRQERQGRVLEGFFPYGETATIRDRGLVRKESIRSQAFRFAVEDDKREIHLLSGHSFALPLAAKTLGTLILADTAARLTFRAVLPAIENMPTWMQDLLKMVDSGLVRGVSPGFRVPPIPNAQRFLPEPGNPGVQVREIREAVLYELSLVTRPAYPSASVSAPFQLPEAASKFQDSEVSGPWVEYRDGAPGPTDKVENPIWHLPYQ